MIKEFAALGCAAAITIALPESATAQQLEVGPKVGDAAPAFSLRAVTKDGPMADAISLASQKGNTVVIAFFPRARTRGCTIQMEAYRDRFASVFNGGNKVTLIGVSTDPDSALISWAKDAGFPFAFASDADGALGRAYGALDEGSTSAKRLLFVIGPDGRISYKATPFRQSTEEAYTELETAIDKQAGR
jgi:thioredoxin-dependent peroxiredoxin